jgi:hypothetical protein
MTSGTIGAVQVKFVIFGDGHKSGGPPLPMYGRRNHR